MTDTITASSPWEALANVELTDQPGGLGTITAADWHGIAHPFASGTTPHRCRLCGRGAAFGRHADYRRSRQFGALLALVVAELEAVRDRPDAATVLAEVGRRFSESIRQAVER